MAAAVSTALTTALSISDLNTTINHEPRVRDLRIAEALGFDVLRNIRKLIARHVAALEKFGSLHVEQTSPTGRGGRPGREYWLNKRQALYIAAKSDTPRAAEITVQMVEVFEAFMLGQMPTLRPTLPTEAARAIESAMLRAAEYVPAVGALLLGDEVVIFDTTISETRDGDEALVFCPDGLELANLTRQRGDHEHYDRRHAMVETDASAYGRAARAWSILPFLGRVIGRARS